ncbi:Uncharacterized protein TCM_036311 [Theobroma cacao]|uniref:Uncharacterized protein n=1 Tax=Theobroma cacao TaxID=3641 RepID=A0A061FII5_THECC|nr:Uncharacterized protein TCM_036311 [Theobroma cacao]
MNLKLGGCWCLNVAGDLRFESAKLTSKAEMMIGPLKRRAALFLSHHTKRGI